jgi:RNA polymerase sigma factor for flagellar operon FliA
MSSGSPFEANLDVIERAIARVCRDSRLSGADAEDFASSARLSLLAGDCAILRKFAGRASMATYVTVVVRRLLVDARRSEGRWYASAEAQRRGEAAVQLERLVHRDRRPLAEAVMVVRETHPELSEAALEEIAAALPERAPRPVLQTLDDGGEERFAAKTVASDRIDELDVAQRSKALSDVVRAAMAVMTPADRVILRLRFREGASIADIARALGTEQRPLYRRVETLLASLRRALQAAGLDAHAAADLIGAAGEHLDFGLDGNQSGTHPSMKVDR